MAKTSKKSNKRNKKAPVRKSPQGKTATTYKRKTSTVKRGKSAVVAKKKSKANKRTPVRTECYVLVPATMIE